MTALVMLASWFAGTMLIMVVGNAIRRAWEAREAKRLPVLAKQMEKELLDAPVAHDERLMPGAAGYREADRSHEIEQALAAEYEAAVQRDRTRGFARSKWGMRLATGIMASLLFACFAMVAWGIAAVLATMGVSFVAQGILFALAATVGTAAVLQSHRRAKQTRVRVAAAEATTTQFRDADERDAGADADADAEANDDAMTARQRTSGS